METHVTEASKAVTSAEKKLKHALSAPEPDFVQLETRLEQVRIACGNLALIHRWSEQDADAEQVEQKLWDLHVRLNTKFKPHLKSFREGQAQKKHVERRKAEKLYLDFIKASQRFYRGFIDRLATNFTQIPKVEAVARKLSKESLSVQAQKAVSADQCQSLEKACTNAVIHLGDLSRWREAETQRKEYNWGPAVGYYSLALELDPAAAICYNQLAIISRHDGSHFNAVYYFYRAATTARPFPAAVDSLQVEFSNLVKKMPEESYGLTDTSADDMLIALVKRYLAFHSQCYSKPDDFVAFQQKATDILGLIALAFQDTTKGPFDDFLKKAILVNISAEWVAEQGTKKSMLSKQLSADKAVRESDRSCQSYFLLQRFNMMTFQALLKVLSRELESTAENAGTSRPRPTAEALSPLACRVLPHLRQYSSWFLSNIRSLTESRLPSSRRALEQLSKIYVQALNLVKNSIDVFAPSAVDCLLDEDDKTISFTPFTAAVHKWRYLDPNGVLKPLWKDNGLGKTSDEEFAEMHLRATDLVVDALRIIKHQDEIDTSLVPIDLDNGELVAKPIPDPPRPETPPPEPPKTTWRSRTHAHQSSLNGAIDSPPPPTPKSARNSNSHAKKHRSKHSIADVEMSDSPAERSNSADVAARVIPKNTPPPSEQPGPKTFATTQNIQPPQPTPSPTAVADPIPSPSFDSSNVITSTPRPSTGTLTAMDLVRGMQRNTATSPQPSHRAQFTPTPNQASLLGIFNAPAGQPPGPLRSPLPVEPRGLTSSAIFEEQMAQQRREISERAFPLSPPPAPSSWETPRAYPSTLRAFQQPEISSPTLSPPATYLNGHPSQPRSPVHRFGAIGQPRPVSGGSSNT